jgi:hypothetical protein
VDRRALVARVGEYLGFRASHFAVGHAGHGASQRQLWEMARHNTALGLGSEWAEGLEEWEPRLASLGRGALRVETDNKLQPWEWLLLPEGRLLKADAVDHHQGHDLVGCQDISWDIAGAAVELGLTEEELAALVEEVARRCGRAPEPERVCFHRLCYLAFQLGHHALGAEALEVGFPAEAVRLRRAAGRYASRLRHLLGSRPGQGRAGGRA